MFFNDSVSKKEDGTFYISESYYSEERISNLKYTDVILKGKELKEDEVMDYNGFYYMPSTSSAVYHTPILESFLNYYF